MPYCLVEEASDSNNLGMCYWCYVLGGVFAGATPELFIV